MSASKSAGTPYSLETSIWRHFRLRLPADWEMLQFSRNPEIGKCGFADRYNFRFELNWKVVPGAPDFDRMLSDYAAKLGASNHSGVKRVAREGWRGLESSTPTMLTSRFGRFFEEESCLLEVVFLWPGKHRDGSLQRKVLRSIRYESPTGDHLRRWRTLGMDFFVPDGLALEECTALPARAEITFTDRRKRSRHQLSRLGLVDHWLKTPVTDHVKSGAAKALKNMQDLSFERNGHRITCLVGSMKSPPVPVFGPGRGVGLHCGWICPESGRLYHMTMRQPGSRAEDLLQWAERLSCCSRKRLAS